MTYTLSQVVDDLGPHCPRCRMPAYVTKIEHGPRIGKRITFKCVNDHRFQTQDGAR